ncbi:LamG domain-containing protein [Candidatus Poribacteria bacterium]|nr:LamG domain-containing protein [Candidatus Poribacteria bacterium]
MNLMRFCILVVGLCFIVITTTNAAIDPDTIMGMWLFNEGTGNTVKDSSANGNDGKIEGGVKRVDGKFGNGIELNGSDGWVTVDHSDTVGFKKGTSFTITVYFKGTKVAGALVGKGYEDTSQVLPWFLLWNGGQDNKVTLFLRNTASQSFRAESTSEIGDDKWHFVAGIADAESGKISIWIDGKKEAEVEFDNNDDYGTTESVLHFGRHYDRYTAGIIDEVGLFSTALDEDDMNTIMDNGLEEAASVDAKQKLTTTWGRIKNKVQ